MGHADNRTRYAALRILCAAIFHGNRFTPNLIFTITHSGCSDGVTDQGKPIAAFDAKQEAQHVRVDMYAIRDHVKGYVISRESPANRPRLAMMQRRHRIHEVGHVASSGFVSLVEGINICPRMAD